MNLETGEWEYTTFYLRDDEPDPDQTKTFIAESLKSFVQRNYGPGYLVSISTTLEELKRRMIGGKNNNDGYYKS